MKFPEFKITNYHILISHRYYRSEEYRRLVSMLERQSARDSKWKWTNRSIPVEQPISMTDSKGRLRNYIHVMQEHMSDIHAILMVMRDEWIEDIHGQYEELTEAAKPPYRPNIPIVSVLPRGGSFESLEHGILGTPVRWNSSSIVSKIKEVAIPASPEELQLTKAQNNERNQIVQVLKNNRGSMAAAALALGISVSTLRRRRIYYIIR